MRWISSDFGKDFSDYPPGERPFAGGCLARPSRVGTPVCSTGGEARTQRGLSALFALEPGDPPGSCRSADGHRGAAT